jgi:hypothetical protein
MSEHVGEYDGLDDADMYNSMPYVLYGEGREWHLVINYYQYQMPNGATAYLTVDDENIRGNRDLLVHDLRNSCFRDEWLIYACEELAKHLVYMAHRRKMADAAKRKRSEDKKRKTARNERRRQSSNDKKRQNGWVKHK